MEEEAKDKDAEVTPEEAAALGIDPDAELEEEADGEEEDAPDGPKKGGIPEWATLPANVKIPPRAKLTFMRFKAPWTEKPEGGDRWCLCWPLTEDDELVALNRAGDNSKKAVTELARQSIRVVDGFKADWTGTPSAKGNVRRFWREIGAKCRKMVVINYHRTHNLSASEMADFLENGIVDATAESSTG